MPEVRIAAEPRTEFGKGGARRTRRAGKIPAVLYGHGTDPRHISLPTREFEHALRTDGANVLLDLQLADGSELALPKSIQRDPVRGGIEHLDLILVRRGERIAVDVALHVVGDVVSGGLLEQSLTTLAVTAEATNIPSAFEVSIDGLEIGAAIHAGQVELPAGVELAGDADQLVLHVVSAPTAEELAAEGAGEAEGEAAEGEAAEGEAAAEAEGGEAPAAEGGSEEPAAE
ncbi:MAG TPA: 50S ribosomal protein L25/general stress protein Ctc [Mycobacteriales bacterium]|nr:50S ribosomal protein L25/general stress protein Ctc [Mycobacteriales bacterium]